MASAAAISDHDFAARLTALAPVGPLALAVSGGPDSMALLVLAARFGIAQGRSVTALTVDHGLREASAGEAEQVAHWAARLGVPHVTLAWEGDKPSSDVQAAARAARYRLMAQWCVTHGVHVLAVAHTRDDQAETFLMRLARGSGVDGLSAMAPVRDLDARVKLVRPLLDFSREAVLEALRAADQRHIEDPSNSDPKYARARMRTLAPLLAEEGMTAERLAATAARMARARDALETWTADVMRRAVRLDAHGFAVVDADTLLGAHEEIVLRALSRLIMAVGGNDYPPRLEAVERLRGDLGSPDFRGATLGGVHFAPRGSHGFFVLREAQAALDAPPVRLEEGMRTVWDGRFEFIPGARHAGAEVRALGPAGWRAVKAVVAELGGRAAGEAANDSVAGIPAAAGAALPALYRDGRIAGVPHLDPVGLRLRFLAPEKLGLSA